MTFPAERTAIVTGAVSERGIGRATVNYLAAQGWNIGIIDLDDAACKAAAKEVAAEFGVKAHGVGANVASEAEVRAAIDELEAELPQIVAWPTWPASARPSATSSWNRPNGTAS